MGISQVLFCCVFFLPSLCTESTPILAGCSLVGTIDGKFDNGYLVTVNYGTDQLKGVLYHVPLELPTTQNSTSAIPSRRRRKRSRRSLKDPFRPKSNRSGYNFFFAEHYARLKPLHYGEEKVISKKIGHLWSNLTEAEREVGCDRHFYVYFFFPGLFLLVA